MIQYDYGILQVPGGRTILNGPVLIGRQIDTPQTHHNLHCLIHTIDYVRHHFQVDQGWYGSVGVKCLHGN